MKNTCLLLAELFYCVVLVSCWEECWHGGEGGGLVSNKAEASCEICPCEICISNYSAGHSWAKPQSFLHFTPVIPLIPSALHHFIGYSKTRSKKLVTHAESHTSAVSLVESGEYAI